MPDPSLASTLARLHAAAFSAVGFSVAPDATIRMRHRDATYGSVFQPVLSVVDRGTVGHAARLAPDAGADDGASIAALVAAGASDAEILELDRGCRTLHALNYCAVARVPGRLFLRVHPRLVEAVSNGHGRVFEAILGVVGVPTHAVVIELPGEVSDDPALLRRALPSYRGRGYKVSCDWAGADDPVLAKRVEVAPDVIVVDVRAVESREELPRIVGAIHARGAQAMVTRIETAAQLAAARRAGADFVRGLHTGAPRRMPQSPRLADDPVPVEEVVGG